MVNLQRLKGYLRLFRISYTDIANAIGLNNSTVAKYMKGGINIPDNRLDSILKFLEEDAENDELKLTLLRNYVNIQVLDERRNVDVVSTNSVKQRRLIDANSLMSLLERELDMNGITDWGKGYMEAIHDAMERVKFMPTLETNTVKHGRWFLLDECSNAGVYCSVCHKKVYKADYANQKVKSNYCPNCGAIMDLDRDSV